MWVLQEANQPRALQIPSSILSRDDGRGTTSKCVLRGGDWSRRLDIWECAMHRDRDEEGATLLAGLERRWHCLGFARGKHTEIAWARASGGIRRGKTVRSLGIGRLVISSKSSWKLPNISFPASCVTLAFMGFLPPKSWPEQLASYLFSLLASKVQKHLESSNKHSLS